MMSHQRDAASVRTNSHHQPRPKKVLVFLLGPWSLLVFSDLAVGGLVSLDVGWLESELSFGLDFVASEF